MVTEPHLIIHASPLDSLQLINILLNPSSQGGQCVPVLASGGEQHTPMSGLPQPRLLQTHPYLTHIFVCKDSHPFELMLLNLPAQSHCQNQDNHLNMRLKPMQKMLSGGDTPTATHRSVLADDDDGFGSWKARTIWDNMKLTHVFRTGALSH